MTVLHENQSYYIDPKLLDKLPFEPIEMIDADTNQLQKLSFQFALDPKNDQRVLFSVKDHSIYCSISLEELEKQLISLLFHHQDLTLDDLGLIDKLKTTCIKDFQENHSDGYWIRRDHLPMQLNGIGFLTTVQNGSPAILFDNLTIDYQKALHVTCDDCFDPHHVFKTEAQCYYAYFIQDDGAVIEIKLNHKINDYKYEAQLKTIQNPFDPVLMARLNEWTKEKAKRKSTSDYFQLDQDSALYQAKLTVLTAHQDQQTKRKKIEKYTLDWN